MKPAQPDSYDGFISYSHAAVTGLAPALQHAVQRFATPWYRVRSLRLFRDDTALSADPRLWATIEKALGSSSWFILLASPQAAASPWVNKEVEWWLAHRGTDRLLIVLVAGSLVWDPRAGRLDPTRTDALPPALVHALTEEPRWVDYTFVRDAVHVDRRDPRFVAGVADIAAALHGRPKDSLVGEDVRQHRRARFFARSAVATLATLLVAAVVLSLVVLSQQGTVVRQRDEALSVLMATAADEVRERDQRAALQMGVVAFHAAGGSPSGRRLAAAAEGNLLQTLLTPYRGTLPGDGSPITGTAWSPDGRSVAVASRGGDIALGTVDGRTETLRSHGLQYSGDEVRSMSFSPDGRRLAVAAADGEIAILELGERPRAAESMRIAVGDPLAVHWGADDVVVVAPGELVRWAPGSSPRTSAFPADVGPSPANDGRASVALSPDGSLLLTAVSATNETTLWGLEDPSGPRRLATIPAGQRISPGAFTADSGTMITYGEGGTIVRWDLADRRNPVPSAPVRVVTREIVSAGITPDGSTVVAANSDNSLVVLDPAGWKQLDVLGGLRTMPVELAISPDGAMVLAGTLDGTTGLWSLDTELRASPLTASDSPVVTVTTSRDRRIAVTGSLDGTVAIYDVVGERLEHRTSYRAGGIVGGLALDPAGTTLAVGAGSVVSVWDIGGAGPPTLWRDDYDLVIGAIETMAFADEGRTLVIGGQGPGLWRWNWTQERALPEPLGEDGMSLSVFALAVSPDGSSVATSNPITNELEIRDQATGDVLRTVPNGHATAAVDALTFVSDSVLATGGRDRVVVFTDVSADADRREVGRLEMPAIPLGQNVRLGYIFALALSTDRRLLAVGVGDGTTHLWDLSDPRHFRPLGAVAVPGDQADAAPPQNATGLAFVGDDRSLISATSDAPAQVIDTGAVLDMRAHVVDVACARANGALSAEDWGFLAAERPYEDTCP